MNASDPHFLLFSDSGLRTNRRQQVGRWRFVLEAVDGTSKLAAADDEPQVGGDRLELLALVRGLEALDQPSRVTLVTSSRYVSRGIRYGLEEWRRNGWRWERYGKMAPVKNGDLWRRVDLALRYHTLECRSWRFRISDDDLADVARSRSTRQHVGEQQSPAAARFWPWCWFRAGVRGCRELLTGRRRARELAQYQGPACAAA